MCQFITTKTTYHCGHYRTTTSTRTCDQHKAYLAWRKVPGNPAPQPADCTGTAYHDDGVGTTRVCGHCAAAAIGGGRLEPGLH